MSGLFLYPTSKLTFRISTMQGESGLGERACHTAPQVGGPNGSIGGQCTQGVATAGTGTPATFICTLPKE